MGLQFLLRSGRLFPCALIAGPLLERSISHFDCLSEVAKQIAQNAYLATMTYSRAF